MFQMQMKVKIKYCYTRYFRANGSTNQDVFQPKTFLIPRGIIPQNFSSLGFAVSEELGNKQTNKQIHSLTDWRFYRVITLNLDVYLDHYKIFCTIPSLEQKYSNLISPLLSFLHLNPNCEVGQQEMNSKYFCSQVIPFNNLIISAIHCSKKPLFIPKLNSIIYHNI